MRKFWSATISALLLSVVPVICNAQVDPKWKIHDLTRPLPPVIDPGTPSTQDLPGRPPSDAVVLFDGKDLSKWTHKDGTAAKWRVENGYAEVVAKSGYIYTREAFGDCQLHVEFSEPVSPKGESQERGNSGVFLMGLYEIQVLDSYENKTYADGQASAVYGQYPPLVNAARPPGQWQSYDIVFHGPRFDTTACSCKTTSSQAGRQLTASARPTKHTPRNCHSACKTTAIPCATATFGSVS